ncbi:MAG: mechanosensitive ion channel family protein [Labilithrix sp.]|nr:mechanosensitive ion channel family protein [Labilithrix sp.]MCW5814512.1 mechanosensitive ion channel family protein [Labilithrix sp.]
MAFSERVAGLFGVSAETLARFAGTAALLVAWMLVGRLTRRVIARTVDDSASRFQMTRVAGYVVGLATTILIARIWTQGIAGVATYLGLLSAGLAIALQDPLANIAGWLYIIVRRPFRVGDRIEVGKDRGDVIDIRPFRFLVLEVGNWVHADQSTGRVLHIPNGSVFKHTIANYDEAFGYIWNEMELTITFESDWRAAKKALEGILEEKAEKLDAQVRQRIDAAAQLRHIKFPKPTPVVWTSVVENGVRLTMRYLCQPRARRNSTAAIWESVLDAFGSLPNVAFAYPTTRRFDNIAEGKAGARAVLPPNVPPSPTRD